MREGAISFEKMNARVENTASADATGNRLNAPDIWLGYFLNVSSTMVFLFGFFGANQL